MLVTAISFILIIITVFIKASYQFMKTGTNPIVEGKGNKGFRKVVGILSMLLFVGVIILSASAHFIYPIREFIISIGDPLFRPYIGRSFFIVLFGHLIFVVSLFNMGRSWRIGVDPQSNEALIKNGLYKISRNPIYVGLIIEFFGVFLSNALPFYLGFLIIFVLAVHLKIREEEQFLEKAYPKEFRDYYQKTGRYLTVFKWKI